MEYCKESTLLNEIKKNDNKLKDKSNKKKIISQLAAVIGYLHEKNLIHRAIKLKNIFLDKNMNLKLGDFGDPTLENTSTDSKYSEISEDFTQQVNFSFMCFFLLNRKSRICISLEKHFSLFGMILNRINKETKYFMPSKII